MIVVVGASVLKPLLVVTDENPDESIRVEPDHHRDRPSIGKGFRPFLCGRPAISVADLFFTRNNTVPSGSNVKVTRSPSFMCKRSLISFGIVVWPLLVRVASMLMCANLTLLNSPSHVRPSPKCFAALTTSFAANNRPKLPTPVRWR